jgi:long-chain acyl-CoA synthetase
VGVSQIVANLEHRVDAGRDILLTTIPFSSSFSFVLNFLSFYWMGAKNILIPFCRPLGNLRRTLEEHRISWMVGAPNYYRSLATESWFLKSPPLHMKGAISVGMSLQRDIAEDFMYHTGAPLVQGYGLSEACSVATLNSLVGGSVYSNSVGMPLGCTELSIVDNAGRAVAVGTVGEIALRGGQIMIGYWNKPEATNRVLRDGWLYTGDLGHFLDDGTCRIVGRKPHSVEEGESSNASESPEFSAQGEPDSEASSGEQEKGREQGREGTPILGV